jgi:pre-mRNA-splicing factor CWC22
VLRINEDETKSSSRIFIIIILQEMTEQMGLHKLKQRFFATTPAAPANTNTSHCGGGGGTSTGLSVVPSSSWYSGMFPKDITNIRNTKYAINFFTSIGLGPLTDDLRDYVKEAPKLIMELETQKLLHQEQAATTTTAATTVEKRRNKTTKNKNTNDDDDDDSRSTTSSYQEQERQQQERQQQERKQQKQQQQERQSNDQFFIQAQHAGCWRSSRVVRLRKPSPRVWFTGVVLFRAILLCC